MSNSIDPRVLFAAERTLLAWNRTSLAFIAFGFLVDRSGLLILLLMPDKTSAFSMLCTAWLGLGFIVLGVLSALYSSRQYAVVLKVLGQSDIPKGYSAKWGVVVNAVVALFGVGLFVALLLGQ